VGKVPAGPGRRGELFSAVLREQGSQRMVYTTSMGTRIVFLVTLLVVILSIASVPEGSFLSRFNAFSLALIAVCLFGALYVQRWVFDKKSNLFEKNVGILFLYRREKEPLDSLQKIVFHEASGGTDESPRLVGLTSRRIAILSVVDRDSRAFKLDSARGGSVRELRRSAERLCSFCAIPLESEADNSAAEAQS
jgi:hypothetical protein